MRLGLMVGATEGTGNGLQDVVDTIVRAESDGFDDVWMAHILGLDAITVLSLAGAQTSKIGLGTAVVPAQPRHPTAIAQQALTAGVACNGRFNLGVGLSHKMFIEDILGLSYDKPAATMREYLEVLAPLLRGEKVEHAGTLYNINGQVTVPGAQEVPIIVAAMGPMMLKAAGELSSGTTTWVTGPKTLETLTIPTINDAAKAAGKATPSVVAGLPIVLTNDKDAAKAVIAEQLVIYGMLPSYRAMLDREGAAGPEDVAIVGNEAEVRAEIQRLRDIGVSHFNAAIVGYEDGAWERTYQFLKSEL